MQSLRQIRSYPLSIPPAVVTILAIMALGAAHGEAAVQRVRTLSDNGRGSLRYTLEHASDGDVVRVGVAGTIVLTSGELTVSKDLTIEADAPCPVVLSANGAGRILHICGGEVTLSGLTLVNGHDPSGGGAILSSGNLLVKSCVFSNNAADLDGGNGGGILQVGGKLTVLDSHFSRGTARAGAAVAIADGNLVIRRSVLIDNVAGSGGAVLVEASRLSLVECTLSLNQTVASAGAIEFYRACTSEISRCHFERNVAGVGGGVMMDDFDCVTEISDSTFAGNRAETSDGGAILLWSILNVARCTFADNHAPVLAGGGAIYNCGTLMVESSTFSGNSSSFIGGAIQNYAFAQLKNTTITGNTSFSGGGLSSFDDPGVQLTIENTIVAGNRSLALDVEYSPDVAGVVTSLDYNLIGDVAGGLLAGDRFHSVLGDTANPKNPMLGPLQSNGGWTLTHLPLPGSPAIDAGVCTGVSVDQRGLPRRVGLACDIGSVEVQ